MPYGRNLTPEQLRYAHRWALVRAAFFDKRGPHYAELAADCRYQADIHLSALRAHEQNAT